MYPAESNKEISKKLGLSWRTLSVQEKNKYYQRAKIIDSEHKKKYPSKFKHNFDTPEYLFCLF